MPESNAKPIFPRSDFTSAKSDERKRKLPQCIAHRGFSAQYPENTLAAFHAAVEVGAHALEMDLQLTKDEVVVVSHDPSLQSHFGRPGQIADHDWSEMQDLKTLKEPRVPMPRLVDVLTWLLKPEAQHVWILLEIKVTANARDIMRHVGPAIRSIRPAPERPWEERIVFTVLPPSYLAMVAEHIPGFPVSHIGFSRSCIRELLPIPGVSFNIAFPLLVFPGGSRLLAQAQKKHDKPVYTWVVNEEATMTWCIRRGLDGVLTDDPKKFLEACRRYDERAKEPWIPFSLGVYWNALVAVASMAHKAWSKRKFLKPVKLG